MADQKDDLARERPDLVDPMGMGNRDLGELDTLTGEVLAGAPVHQTVIMAQSREVTARKVAVPRSLSRIQAELRVYAQRFGDTYAYSWPVKDRASGKTDTVEGPTIKLANDLVMAYGNCSVDVDVSETATHYVFKGWFVDLESGVAVSRIFNQRKSQKTGMKDSDRAADIVFQIGQSKAIRNVVVNALSSLTAYVMEEAKANLIEKFAVEANWTRALKMITGVMEDEKIAMLRVEAVVGRKVPEWTVRDKASVYMQMRGIKERMTTASEVYPDEALAATIVAEKEAKKKVRDDAAPEAKKDQPAKEPAKEKDKEPPPVGPAAPGGDKADPPAPRTQEPGPTPQPDPKADAPPGPTESDRQDDEPDGLDDRPPGPSSPPSGPKAPTVKPRPSLFR